MGSELTSCLLSDPDEVEGGVRDVERGTAVCHDDLAAATRRLPPERVHNVAP